MATVLVKTTQANGAHVQTVCARRGAVIERSVTKDDTTPGREAWEADGRVPDEASFIGWLVRGVPAGDAATFASDLVALGATGATVESI